MRHSYHPKSFLEDMQISLRDPSGLVCAALVLALVAMAIRIASIW